MEIPYTVAERPDTGLNNGKIGIWLFLASEVMLFGALFATYLMLRIGAADVAARRLDPQRAARHAQHRGADLLQRHHGDGLGLAQAQRLRQVPPVHGRSRCWPASASWSSSTSSTRPSSTTACCPSTNTFLAIYFTLTGLHGLHVIGGMAVNGYLWGPGAKLWKTDPEHFTNRVENSGLFWHFVDLVWIFLFPVLYLL